MPRTMKCLKLCFLPWISVLLLTTGCGGGGSGTPPTAPDPSTLMVSVEPAAIGLFGEARIMARALRSGSPVPAGTEISLTTDLGRFDASSLQTDSDGRVFTRLRGTGVGGSATIVARLAGTSSSATATVTIGVGLVLDLRAEPATIDSEGSAQVIATLTDDGNPVTGTQINLSTSLGRLDNPTPRTDALGNAVTRLLGNGSSGTATVTASSPGVEPAQAEILIGSALQLSLVATPTTIATDGNALLTATLRRFGGGPGPPGLVVRLSTDLGRLDRTDPLTNTQGVATTTLRGDGRSGTATIVAQVDGADESAVVRVTVGAGASLALSASPSTIPANGTSELSAILSQGGAAVSGDQILFSTTLGRLEPDRATTNAQGLAAVQLRGQGLAGTARITATSPSTGASSTADVILQ